MPLSLHNAATSCAASIAAYGLACREISVSKVQMVKSSKAQYIRGGNLRWNSCQILILRLQWFKIHLPASKQPFLKSYIRYFLQPLLKLIGNYLHVSVMLSQSFSGLVHQQNGHCRSTYKKVLFKFWSYQFHTGFDMHLIAVVMHRSREG